VLSFPQVTLENPVIPEVPWDAIPGTNATGNLIFQSITSLLQHWPNTKYRYGQTIVAASIAPGTLLYHGTREKNAAFDTPNWVATDPEHSYALCFETCQLLGFTTTKKLHLAYFDGTSAATMPSGTMDSQDILIWGEVRPDRYLNELKRIVDVCNWGKRYGLDGFVRMEMNFEVMICDFSNGLQLVFNSSILMSDAFMVSEMRNSRRILSEPLPGPGDPVPFPAAPDGWKGSLRENRF